MKVLRKLNLEGKIESMYPVGAGGIAEAISKMSFGNKIGVDIEKIPQSSTSVTFKKDASIEDLFVPQYGAIIVESAMDLETNTDFVDGTVNQLGETISQEKIIYDKFEISLDELENAWESKLANVFPPVSGAELQKPLPNFALKEHESLVKSRSELSSAKTSTSAATTSATSTKTSATSAAKEKSAKFQIANKSKSKPKVIIPVFPGTNCEYDLARAFNLNGAQTKILVFKNRTSEELSLSLEALKSEIDKANILAFAGGFSSGDEPDGSGKYIANVIRENRISESIMNLLKNRDGLILGICNGFQALIKTGLVPYGEIREPNAKMPTLTFNKIGRHVSRVVRTRIVSAISPWAQNATVLDPKLHLIPVSHGEGRIFISQAEAKRLFENGQVFSQYVDVNGVPAISEPDNPNGSLFAIEGLTSPDGRVLGKMGHNERTMGTNADGSSSDLIKNIAVDVEHESSCENIFKAGVEYFK